MAKERQKSWMAQNRLKYWFLNDAAHTQPHNISDVATLPHYYPCPPTSLPLPTHKRTLIGQWPRIRPCSLSLSLFLSFSLSFSLSLFLSPFLFFFCWFFFFHSFLFFFNPKYTAIYTDSLLYGIENPLFCNTTLREKENYRPEGGGGNSVLYPRTPFHLLRLSI